MTDWWIVSAGFQDFILCICLKHFCDAFWLNILNIKNMQI